MRPNDQALKLASANLVEAVGGGLAATGFCAIIRQQTLSEYGLVGHPSFMRVDVARDLENVTQGQPGHPLVTRELARQQGYGLLKLPTAKPDHVSWLEHLAACAKEANDVVCELSKALADGKLCAAERTAVRQQIAEALAALVNLDGALAALEDTS